jgi:hypothetical protein
MVAGLYRELAVDDPMVVFRHLFAQLAPRVTVYPTENYYYFGFMAGGRAFSGNFRLSPDARAEGRIHFAYFDSSEPRWFRHLYLGPEHGVAVAAAGHLEYEVTFEGRTVRFVLNDLPQTPPALPLLPGERFIGRSLDESGMVFLLLYDTETQGFIWVLDTATNHPLHLLPLDEELAVDIRTFFVFFHDREPDRLVLAGVDLKNVIANNYFDGPFDQLPDNHIADTAFAEYAADAYPGTRGLLNRRGEGADGTARLAVTPYLQYGSLQELTARKEACQAQAGRVRAALYACLFHDYKKG